ncbi:cytochrome P450 [Pacificimonas sp. WHA3]|uniref:Cytochrome P450 n=1 Tax=Pacificimonas pallii TaxID=2827236 RepID=A0ABS6SD54_9SPHN|nr:cytochrome P450 [Pacificimonas pallii]MBV7256266.1 cytochrome P450 [Pacificimonas pallii]
MNAPVDPKEFRTDDGSTPAERYRRLREPTMKELNHLPGTGTLSLWQKLAAVKHFLYDTLALQERRQEAYGPVYSYETIAGPSVQMVGADANEMVLMNRDRIFSSEQGWNPILGKLFPRGLMMLDFEEHRVHRKALSVAFKPKPMQAYLSLLQEGIRRRIADWPERLELYPAMKDLTLDLAASSFLGIPWGPEADKVNRAFVDMVQASVTPVRKPLPFTQMRKGVRGRAYLVEYFGREIPKRRGSDAEDIFTQVVNAHDEEGELLSDQDVIDHMNFLMMAAHDTLTSSLSSTVFYLGKTPDWQEKIRHEVETLRAEVGADIPYDRLGDLDMCEWAFKEAMRLRPPVPFIPRRALADFTFHNHVIPAGAHVGLCPMLVHRDPNIWPEPERYDPSRFTRENEKVRHKHAYVPFGGGAHMCLGLHFAYMQAKVFLFELLAARTIDVPVNYEPQWQMVPIPRPRDNLPLGLIKRA